nr:DUF1127 domain-containing protein [uncultured Pseudomonas sp.]
MNGLSDVRLTLAQQELTAQARPQVSSRTNERLPGKARWQRFWLRLNTRRTLLRLNDEQLKDIGLTRQQALDEALRPFWKL